MVQNDFVENVLLNELRYCGDNSLLIPASPYQRNFNGPRCRLITSWSCSRFQGSVCSTVKVLRELGLERRETVWILSSYSDLKIEKICF